MEAVQSSGRNDAYRLLVHMRNSTVSGIPLRWGLVMVGAQHEVFLPVLRTKLYASQVQGTAVIHLGRISRKVDPAMDTIEITTSVSLLCTLIYQQTL